MSSLSQQLFRRKPVVQMEDESGSETGKSELTRSIGLFQLSMFGVGATIGTGIFFVLSEAVPIAGPGRHLLVRHCRGRRRADRGLLRRTGRRRPGVRIVVLLRLRHASVSSRRWSSPACLLLEYGVSGAAVAVGWSQYLNQLLDNLFGFQIPEALSAGARAGRHHQPARGDPDRAVRAAADPRRQRVRRSQHRDGADQDRRAGDVHRHRHHRVGTPTTSRTSPPSASPESAPRRGSSSSPTSAWTPSPPPVRR